MPGAPFDMQYNVSNIINTLENFADMSEAKVSWRDGITVTVISKKLMSPTPYRKKLGISLSL